MPLIKLKEISQDTWLQGRNNPLAVQGLCYSMCNFIESDKGIWNNPGTFAKALGNAQNFGDGTTMINYAKAQTLRKSPFAIYPPFVGALANNRIYRCQLWFGALGTIPGAINHEVLIVTGAGNEIAFFEPNFGFYECTDPVMAARQSFENFVNQLYAPGSHTGNFTYMNVRAINQGLPLGFAV